MIPIFADAPPNWSSAIGLFIINFGMLDWQLFEFLESRLLPGEFAAMKKDKNESSFKNRLVRVKKITDAGTYLPEQKQAFADFVTRVEPIRELRNHIAHGHMLVRIGEDGKTPVVTLSLPKNLDTPEAPETRHLEFREVTDALHELRLLIEEFKGLSGG